MLEETPDLEPSCLVTGTCCSLPRNRGNKKCKLLGGIKSMMKILTWFSGPVKSEFMFLILLVVLWFLTNLYYLWSSKSFHLIWSTQPEQNLLCDQYSLQRHRKTSTVRATWNKEIACWIHTIYVFIDDHFVCNSQNVLTYPLHWSLPTS